MSEASGETSMGTGEDFSSPPPAETPVRQAPDPRARLLELARELARRRQPRMLMEYLRLRRMVR